MSDILPNHEAGFERLYGQANYSRWACGIESMAKLKGVWSLISGEEEIMDKADFYICKNKAREDLVRGLCHTCLRRTQVYISQHVRVQTAQGLLEYWVDPTIRYDIKGHTSPRDTWLFLENQYKTEDATAEASARMALKNLRFGNCYNMADYLERHPRIRANIQNAGGMLTPDDLAPSIIDGLGEQYILATRPGVTEPLKLERDLSRLTKILLQLEKDIREFEPNLVRWDSTGVHSIPHV